MSRRWRYDVFVSFLEKETGKTISGYLLEALQEMGIVAFKQDIKEVGDSENACEELALKAIEESKTCIVVLSKDYASSRKCLRELTKIMERKSKSKTLRVLPLFYHVDPSHVRAQSGSFEEHFHEHNKTHSQEVLTWRDAMKKVGNLSGCVVHPLSDEAEIIKKMSHQVFSSLLCGLTSSNENLVGISHCFKEMYEHLDIKSDKVVRFIGIVGMGGIGKTTIAEAIYQKISEEFDGSCFLRISGSDTKITSLQSQLLSTILDNNESFKVWDEDKGVEEITRLHCKKVLLVVDGAEKDIHIKKLAATRDWFGPGSRVIITTRSKDLLLNFPNLEMQTYELQPLKEEDSLQLFCKYAFDQQYLAADADNYMRTLCENIVKRASGLPLALKVLGSALRGRPLAIWEEKLESLGQVSENNIIDILKLSFDALEATQQEIFMDIACFFKGKNIKRVTELLESFGYHQVEREVELLINRCLIDLILHERIMMHDLIQDMGREIVRRESSTQFGKQTRIWLHHDFKRVSIQQYGLEETRGIVLDLDEDGELEVEATCISKMTQLRILEINNVHLNQNQLEYLSNLLGFLNWPGCPAKCLPSTFQPGNLIELRMPCSHIVQLWEGTKKFGSLKLIDLSDSKKLLKTPDLSGVRNLEILVLRGCTILCEIHSSITRLNRLACLDLKDCSNLKTFSSKIACRKLKTFILSGCSSLENFPEIEGKMEHLAELYLDGTPIRNLHSSIGRLIGLVLLNLRDCKRLSSLPNVIGKFKSLRTLILHGCSLLDQIELSSENADCLEELDLSETSLTQLPPSIHLLKNLKVLRCQGLFNSIWHSLNTPSFGLLCLTSLDLSHCNLVDEDIPQDLHNFSSLQVIDLSGNHFVSLGGDCTLCQLSNLKKLYLHNCTKLQRFPQLIPTSLQTVEGRDCVSIAKYFYNKELSIPSARVGVLSFKFPITKEEHNFKFMDMDDIFSTGNRMSKQRYLERLTCDEGYELSSEMDHTFDCFYHKEKGNTIEFCCSNNPYDSSTYGKRFEAIAVAVGIQMTKLSALGTRFSSHFMIRLETDGYPSKCLWNEEKKCGLMSRAKVCVFYIPFEKLSKEVRNEDFRYIKASITSKNPNIKVEKCGASVLFRKDVPVFLRHMLIKSFQNRPKFSRISKNRCHLSEGKYVEIEDPHHRDSFSSVSSSENDSSSEHSIVLLKRSLKSILRRTFEEENMHAAPLFIFPGKEISSWFKHQQEEPTLTIMLPRNLQKDKKWMGLAVSVVFSVEGHLGRHYYTFSYEIDGDEVQYARAPRIKMPKFLLDDDGSHQVCVLFQPRASFTYGLNYSDHIHANITTHPDVKVVSCGARLVYQHNVKGLIETIANRVCQSPRHLHDYCSTMFLDTFFLIITTSSGTEDPRVPKPATIDLIIQDPFKTRFDCFLYGHECLSLFTFEEGNNVKMELPQGLCLNGSWMGFVVYALVTLNRPTTNDDDHKLKQALKIVDLVCQFRADSDLIEPDHFLIIGEDDILEGRSDQFIWLFYVPRTELDIVWEHCACLEASMVTNLPELLSVRKCGMQMVDLQHKEIIQHWAASSFQKKQHHQSGA